MIRILIVEDEEAIANLVRMNLVKAGYECHVAASGTAGADRLAECQYDLCIFDIMLPEIDGYELLEYAKGMDIPVIFLTAKGETPDKVRGLRLGAEDYITKPFDILELMARVDTVLRRYRKTEQELDVCGLHIDIPSRRVTRGEQELDSPMRGCGTVHIWETAGLWIYMCRDCGKRRGWNRKLRLCTK